MSTALVLVKHALPVLDPSKPAREWQLGAEGEVQAKRLADMTFAVKHHGYCRIAGPARSLGLRYFRVRFIEVPRVTGRDGARTVDGRSC